MTFEEHLSKKLGPVIQCKRYHEMLSGSLLAQVDLICCQEYGGQSVHKLPPAEAIKVYERVLNIGKE